MTIKSFIEKAKEGGFDTRPWVEIRAKGMSTVLTAVFLDPEAWKAVGKVEGWGDEKGAFMYEWTVKMHKMIDALAEGKTIEQYLETL